MNTDAMLSFVKAYNEQIETLRKLLKARRSFEQAIALALAVHAETHTSEVSSGGTPTLCDDLLDGLPEAAFSVMPTKRDETIAWHLWHIARIEDLVGNLLIAEQSQILDDAWMEKLHPGVRDTGNAMTDEQILAFSRQVSKPDLICYRNAVGRQTRRIIRGLTPDDLKRKPSAAALARLVVEGGLLEVKDSLWLSDFWGRHTVAGLLLLPLTRHHMMHLPDSMAIKQFTRTDETPFLS